MDQSTPDPRDRVVLQDVLHAIRNVRFSYVQVIVHEGKAIQIDTMEKKRLDRLPRQARLSSLPWADQTTGGPSLIAGDLPASSRCACRRPRLAGASG